MRGAGPEVPAPPRETQRAGLPSRVSVIRLGSSWLPSSPPLSPKMRRRGPFSQPAATWLTQIIPRAPHPEQRLQNRQRPFRSRRLCRAMNGAPSAAPCSGDLRRHSHSISAQPSLPYCARLKKYAGTIRLPGDRYRLAVSALASTAAGALKHSGRLSAARPQCMPAPGPADPWARGNRPSRCGAGNGTGTGPERCPGTKTSPLTICQTGIFESSPFSTKRAVKRNRKWHTCRGQSSSLTGAEE